MMINEIAARKVERKCWIVTICIIGALIGGIAVYGHTCDVQQYAWQQRFLAAYDAALIDESKSIEKEFPNAQQFFKARPDLRRLNRNRSELAEADAVKCCAFERPGHKDDGFLAIAWLEAQKSAWDRAAQQVPMPWPLSSARDKPSIRRYE